MQNNNSARKGCLSGDRLLAQYYQAVSRLPVRQTGKRNSYGTNGLMTHVVAGYPNMAECEKIILAMAETGVAFIEVQIPFSDPITDGPTIMEANKKALLNGTTTEDCFKLIGEITKKIKTPILIMTYFNIPFRYGLEKFCKKAKEINVYGFIIPDIPIDEEKYEHYLGNCKKYGLHAIQIISPITPVARLKKIAKVATGFVYCVSSFGTTGEKSKLNPKLNAYLKKVKEHIKIPIALGFGISNKDQISTTSKNADIVVIGSKIINLYNSCNGNKISAIKEFLKIPKLSSASISASPCHPPVYNVYL